MREKRFCDAVAEVALSFTVGYGLEAGVRMGPVITPGSCARIEGLVGKAEREDARIVRDGRAPGIPKL